jgi:7-carboxy-7-deazaguanine synthase
MIKNNRNSLIINEIYHSIQGESTHSGRPCIFVRLTYCNIRCTYCDSAYAFEDGREMTIEDILTEVRQYDCRLVEVTGGEPLFQENAPLLLSQLCDAGYEVLLETGGTIDIGPVDSRVQRIVDLKCPSSGMMKKNYWKNLEQLRPKDEIKFVIGTRQDYEWSREIVRKYGLTGKVVVLMSVAFGGLEPVRLCEWILQDHLEVRFQLQAHKYIWSPETKGV